jgi:hypothetical protein
LQAAGIIERDVLTYRIGIGFIGQQKGCYIYVVRLHRWEQRCRACIVFAENQGSIGFDQLFNLFQITALGRVMNLTAKSKGAPSQCNQYDNSTTKIVALLNHLAGPHNGSAARLNQAQNTNQIQAGNLSPKRKAYIGTRPKQIKKAYKFVREVMEGDRHNHHQRYEPER